MQWITMIERNKRIASKNVFWKHWNNLKSFFLGKTILRVKMFFSKIIKKPSCLRSSGKGLLPKTYLGNTGFDFQENNAWQCACLYARAGLVAHIWWFGNRREKIIYISKKMVIESFISDRSSPLYYY